MGQLEVTITKDIITRLRERASWLEGRSFAVLTGDIEREAADLIERALTIADRIDQRAKDTKAFEGESTLYHGYVADALLVRSILGPPAHWHNPDGSAHSDCPVCKKGN